MIDYWLKKSLIWKIAVEGVDTTVTTDQTQTPPSNLYQQIPQCPLLYQLTHLNKSSPISRDRNHRSPIPHKSDFPHCLAIPNQSSKNLASFGVTQFDSTICAAADDDSL
jgi:hypothetical protein